jgi:hypothetical protein
MESLLTLSLGEYSSVEIALRLAVTLVAMTAVLLALTASCIAPRLRFPLFLTAVALGGAAWFESGLWQSWKEAFELAGTSYCVTGHLIADHDRITAWSLGVPAILFSFGLVQIDGHKKDRCIVQLGVLLLLVALAFPFFTFIAFFPLIYAAFLLKNNPLGLVARLAPIIVLICLLFSEAQAHYHFSLGGGTSGELVRGEILRSVVDLFSLVIPALLLLIGVLRLSKADQK